ncbi:MAG: lytic transglycosylase domain-containing protein [Bryobacteraceae bacterium]|nr:lytic transglycosylase domain-containing protein [Bryobacteraceae bacterium]
MMRVTLLFLVVCGLSGLASEATTRQLTSSERMQVSVARQRETINRIAAPNAGSFFTSGWVVATSLAVDTPGTTATGPAATGPAAASSSFMGCDPLPEEQLTQVIADAARQDGVNPQLIRAIIRRESGARPCAVSEKGAQGLMQLMPATQQDLGVKDPFDPLENVMGGTRYISTLLKRYKGDIRRTLAAYNAGPQRVEPNGPIPDFAETRAYLDAILADLSPLEPAQTPVEPGQP